MNAILSKSVLDAMSVFTSLAPGDLASHEIPISPFVPYTPVVALAMSADSARRWTYPEPHQFAAQFPELVTAFGERAFVAYWS